MNDVISQIVSGIVLSLIAIISSIVGIELRRIKALGKGIQALLRNELYSIYRECIMKGYSTDIDKNNFENLYKQYHALGSNGVMDCYRQEILNMKGGKKHAKTSKNN